MNSQLNLTAIPGIPDVRPGNDLSILILEGIQRIELELLPGDVFALAQKIVSKAEDRFVNLQTISPSQEAFDLAKQTEKDPRLVEVILSESRQVLRTRPGLIIVEHHLGFVCANAGIDHSNVRVEEGEPEDWVLKLPANPDASAEQLRHNICEGTGVDVGVLIIDSHGRAWRLGTIGVVIGIANVPALVDLRGHPDLYGDLLETTQVGVGDELAAAASLLMGQADESRPVIHIRGFPYQLRESSLAEIIRPKEHDLFR